MSIIQFNHLTPKESELILRTPALVSYLVGGVDDNFDSREEAESKHLIHFRTTIGDPMLFDFYKEVEQTFDKQLHELVEQYGNLQASVRTQLLVEELTKLNDTLPQIDSLYARALLKSFRTLALGVAEASGGFLRFLDVSYEEKHLAGLEMITYVP